MQPGQQPFITYSQLATGGFSPADIRTSLREGQLVRVRRGVYRQGGDLDPTSEYLRLIQGTVPAVSEGNVFSHESAAVLHGLPVPADSLRQVHMTRRSPGHGDGSAQLRVHKSRLDDEEIATVDGLAVTSLARTATDMARSHPFAWGVAACDAALRLGLTVPELWASVARHQRLRGVPRARRVASFADARSESVAESVSRVQFARHGIPEPELQYEVIGEGGEVVARADFGWPALRLVGEVDGRWKYGGLLKPGQSAETAIMNEKRREEQIRLAGFWIVRWDWDLCWKGAELAARVERAMRVQNRDVR